MKNPLLLVATAISILGLLTGACASFSHSMSGTRREDLTPSQKVKTASVDVVTAPILIGGLGAFGIAAVGFELERKLSEGKERRQEKREVRKKARADASDTR